MTRGVWISADDGARSAAWFTPSASTEDTIESRAVLVLPPIGYAYSSAHRFCRRVAERAAAVGVPALRLDYWGTGDSAGAAEDVVSLAPWRASVAAAAAWLRERGGRELIVVGVQIGAVLAGVTAAEVGPAAAVSVAPPRSPRRFTRGLSVLGLPVPEEHGGGVSVGGFYFTSQLMADLAAVEVPDLGDLPHLEVDAPESVMAFMERPAEEAVVDEALVEEIASWIADVRTEGLPVHGAVVTRHLSDEPAVACERAEEAHMTWRGVELVERFETLGPDGLAGMLTAPAGAAADGAGKTVFVLLSSGSDPHIGPGRAWVEMSRWLAAAGTACLRVDFRGWGESPDGPTTPGRPYDQHSVEDVATIAKALHDQGRTVVLGGLCAGAYAALAATRRDDVAPSVAGVVALNPQLYWQPGDPVEALMSQTRARRSTEIEEIRSASATGRWDLEDERGLRPPAGLWLDELVARGRPVSMLFAEGDDGIEYLRDRLSRRLDAAVRSGIVRVNEIPEIDHGMHRVWLRPLVYEAVAAQIHEVLDHSVL